MEKDRCVSTEHVQKNQVQLEGLVWSPAQTGPNRPKRTSHWNNRIHHVSRPSINQETVISDELQSGLLRRSRLSLHVLNVTSSYRPSLHVWVSNWVHVQSIYFSMGVQWRCEFELKMIPINLCSAPCSKITRLADSNLFAVSTSRAAQSCVSSFVWKSRLWHFLHVFINIKGTLFVKLRE